MGWEEALAGLSRDRKCRGFRPHCRQTVVVPKSSTIAQKGVLTKVYVFGDKLTVRAVIHSPLWALGTGTESSRKKGHICLHAVKVHETTPRVGQYLKVYWLKEFPQHRGCWDQQVWELGFWQGGSSHYAVQRLGTEQVVSYKNLIIHNRNIFVYN